MDILKEIYMHLAHTHQNLSYNKLCQQKTKVINLEREGRKIPSSDRRVGFRFVQIVGYPLQLYFKHEYGICLMTCLEVGSGKLGGKGLGESVGLLGLGDAKSVQVSRKTDLELGDTVGLLDLDGLGIGTMYRKNEEEEKEEG